jgi:hypothetical protein
MARAPAVHPATELAQRLEAFVIERYPFAVAPVRAAFDACKGAVKPDEASFDTLRTTSSRILLPLLRPSQDTIKNLLHLIFGHSSF